MTSPLPFKLNGPVLYAANEDCVATFGPTDDSRARGLLESSLNALQGFNRGMINSSVGWIDTNSCKLIWAHIREVEAFLAAPSPLAWPDEETQRDNAALVLAKLNEARDLELETFELKAEQGRLIIALEAIEAQSWFRGVNYLRKMANKALAPLRVTP